MVSSQIKQNQNQIKTNKAEVPSKTLSLFCVGQPGPDLEWGWHTYWHCWRKRISSSQQLSVANSFLVKGLDFVFTSLYPCCNFVWFQLLQVLRVLLQSLYVICVLAPLCLEIRLRLSHPAPLAPAIFPLLLWHRLLNFEHRVLIKTSCFWLSVPESLTLYTLSGRESLC